MRDVLPDLTVPPPARDDDDDGVDDDVPSGMLRIAANMIALDVRDAALAKALHASLTKAGRLVAGADAIGSASLVIGDVSCETVRARVTGLRARMDASSALLVLAEDAAVTEAHRLGAAACLRLPLLVDELLTAIDRLIATRATEEHLARLSRELDLQSHLATLGRVASGISHEIANPLTAVMTNIEVLAARCGELNARSVALRAILDARPEDRLRAIESARPLVGAPESDDALEIVADISSQCDRMAELLALMRELAVRRPRTLEAVDLGAVARSVVRLCPPELLRGVELDVVIDEPVQVTANRLVLEQLVLNILTNAAAFARKFASPQVRLHVYASAADGMLSVRDNGPGIPPDLHNQIFEPFYTTRRGEGGTGLGLALCREYAAQMGARLSLWSVPGRGACFRVHLRRSH